jgi:iron(III) transport system substrate-binding protein
MVKSLNFFISAFMLISAVLLHGCDSGVEEVNIYSGRHYRSDEDLFRKFTDQTGIRVNLVKADTDQLINRLKLEGANTRADLLITADAGRMMATMNEGLLQPITSEKALNIVPAYFRDPDGFWVGFTKRARVIVYHRDRVDPGDLTNYEDLTLPLWKDRILVRSSQNHYNQTLMASIIAANGSEKAEQWAEGLVANMAQPPRGNDRDQVKSIAAGTGDIAIVNTYYMGLLLKSPNAEERAVAQQMGIFFPNQDNRGTHINISGIGITAASQNKKNAEKLIEFMLSYDSQLTLATGTHEYPVNPEVPWPALLQEWGSFKEDTVPLSRLGQHLQEAMLIFNRAGWE